VQARAWLRCAAVGVLAVVGACGGGDRAVRGVEAVLVRTVEQDVVIPADSGVQLACTLSLPETAPAAPVLLLLSGSGPHDRDGARADLPGYTPWRDLREALVQASLAVVRCDDRGTGQSSGHFAGATTESFARDALAVLAWLRARAAASGAPAPTVGLVGHSEGAIVALLAARADRNVRALALLGAPARNGRELARWQRQQLVMGDLARWPPAPRPGVLAAADAEADALAQRDPWLRTWFALEPRELARDIRVPTLLLHGTTDRQVPPEQAEELAAVLRRAGASPVDVQHPPNTDHLLLSDRDGDPGAYVRLRDRRIAPAITAVIAQFFAVHMASAEAKPATR
jgi:uncharacterized protein